MSSPRNRQPAPPVTDEALTIEELAERVGMTVRNLREWKTLGLMPPAELRGRTGYYSPDVVELVARIQRLHSEGFTLELIARMLEAGGDAAGEVMQLAVALRAPVAEDVASSEAGPDRITRVFRALEDLGVSADDVLDATARVQAHTEAIAEIFESVWMEQIWEPFIEAGMPDAEAPRVQEAAARVKPLTVEAVVALFTAAMDARIERGIARELGRLDG
jgi:DNA-binding transcriptional MerR regulator